MLVMCVHGDTPDDDTLTRTVSHAASLRLFVDPLETGYSREIHGQVRDCFYVVVVTRRLNVLVT
jgi:hypothetical protein